MSPDYFHICFALSNIEIFGILQQIILYSKDDYRNREKEKKFFFLRQKKMQQENCPPPQYRRFKMKTHTNERITTNDITEKNISKNLNFKQNINGIL